MIKRKSSLINTRESMEEAESRSRDYFQNYLDRFCNFFHNSVRIETSTFKDLPKRYLLKTLLTKGAIAFDKETNLFLPFVASGIDIYGLPKMYNLIGMNGYTKQCRPDQVVILRANDLQTPLIIYLMQQAHKLEDLDMSIEQNLDAVKTMSIVEVPDKATMLSFSNLDGARRLGASVVYVNKGSQIQANTSCMQTGAEYLVDRLMEAKREIMNETFQTLGIGTINTYKKERIQSAEVIASNYYTIDSIHTLIDTFNYDADFNGLDIHLESNTIVPSLEEMEDESGSMAIEETKETITEDDTL